MGVPVETCIKRWSSLRDRYVREKKKLNLPSGSGNSQRYCWPFLGAMEFLAPHVVPRPVRSSTNILTEFASPVRVETNFSESSSSFSSFFAQSPSPIAPSSSPITLSSSPIAPSPDVILYDSSFSSPEVASMNTPASHPNETITTSFGAQTSPKEVVPNKKQKQSCVDVDEVFFEAVKVFKEVCENEKENRNNGNESLQAFGKMIIGTIASMSATKQVIAMQRVTTVVMELKLEPDE